MKKILISALSIFALAQISNGAVIWTNANEHCTTDCAWFAYDQKLNYTVQAAPGEEFSGCYISMLDKRDPCDDIYITCADRKMDSWFVWSPGFKPEDCDSAIPEPSGLLWTAAMAFIGLFLRNKK